MFENDLNSIIVALVAASPAYIKIIVDILNKNNKFEKSFQKLVKAQSKKELTDTMFKALERGYTFQEETDSVETLYEPYHELGWNGKLDNLHARYNGLKVKDIHEIKIKK